MIFLCESFFLRIFAVMFVIYEILKILMFICCAVIIFGIVDILIVLVLRIFSIFIFEGVLYEGFFKNVYIFFL